MIVMVRDEIIEIFLYLENLMRYKQCFVKCFYVENFIVEVEFNLDKVYVVIVEFMNEDEDENVFVEILLLSKGKFLIVLDKEE